MLQADSQLARFVLDVQMEGQAAGFLAQALGGAHSCAAPSVVSKPQMVANDGPGPVVLDNSVVDVSHRSLL